jgi:hypothetical protein
MLKMQHPLPKSLKRFRPPLKGEVGVAEIQRRGQLYRALRFVPSLVRNQ